MTKSKTLATLVSNNNPLADGTLSVGDVTGLQAELDAKQAALVSGTNIKTVGGTGVLGSGDISVGVTSFNTRTGAVTLSSSDVTTALGYTPYNSTNPSGYITSSASITGNAATATTLQTARNINGVSFNGSADITVADSTKLPLAGGTMTGAITFAAGQTWPTFNQNTTGSAATLTTGRTIGMTGDVTWTSGSFNGSANVTGTATLANSGVAANTYGGNNSIPSLTVDAKGRVTAASIVTPSGTWGISISGNAATASNSSALGGVALSNIPSGNNAAAASDATSNMNDLAQKSGFYLYNNPSNAPEATWNTWLTAMGHYAGDRYGWQITQAYWSDTLWTRRLTNNGWASWRRIVDSGNYNSAINRGYFNRESNGGTMVSGQTYSIYTGGGAVGMYLPTAANSAQGDRIVILNLGLQWATNPFYVYMNTNTRLMNLNETMTCNINVGSIVLTCVYHDGTAYWNVAPGG